MTSASSHWKKASTKMAEVEKSKKESQKFQEKQNELGQFRYDKSAKGWRGPASAVGRAITRFKTAGIKQSAAEQNWDHLLSRLRNYGEAQKQTGKQVPHTKKAVADFQNPDLERDDDDDVASISEDPVREKPDIKHPFKIDYSNQPNWDKPVGNTDGKKMSFEFAKPDQSEESVCYTSSHQQVLRLTNQVQERDKTIEALRRELRKAHNEAAKLSTELSRYSGADYEELKQENLMLKSTMSRMVRDNMRLHGEVRAANNSVIHKQKLEEEMERRYGYKTRILQNVTSARSRTSRSQGPSSSSARFQAPGSPLVSERSGPRSPAGAGVTYPRGTTHRQQPVTAM